MRYQLTFKAYFKFGEKKSIFWVKGIKGRKREEEEEEGARSVINVVYVYDTW